MGKRILMLIGMAGAAVLLIVGVAAAAGGPAPSDDVSISTSSSYADTTETTAEATDTTVVVDETTVPGDTTTTSQIEDQEDGDTTDASAAHPDNFGGTISSLRHTGDHTPAAVIKGHKVPGWTKKHPSTTTTIEAPQG